MNSTQLEFQTSGAGLSQCDRILARLNQTPGERVPMPELARVASNGGSGAGLAVHARIGDLNKRGQKQGFKIYNHTDSSVRPHRSVYWIEYFEQP